MFERRSSLASVLADSGREGARGGRECRLGEVTGWSLVQVAAYASTVQALEERLEAIIGELPLGCHSVVPGERMIFRTARDQLWIIGPEDGLANELAQAIGPDIGAVTSLGHSRTRIFLEGRPVAEILAKGVPLDFHSQVFKPGQAALTGLHHTPVLLHRRREDRFEIYAVRTFALSVWQWLTDAALEFGYEVASETA